ncbi:MAG TPA: hypothetical protein VNK82_00645 [Terriglobales bacterium]|nr:hypothetical protein [Terriglobales bacterium]
MSAPNWKQGAILFAAGSVLAASACYGVLLYDSNDSLSLLFAAGFIGGMGLALGGTVLMVVRASSGSGAESAAGGGVITRPTWGQVLVMLASGVVLGASSCYGFLETLGKKGQYWYGPFAAGFYAGCLLVLGAGVLLLLRLVRKLFTRSASPTPR